MTERGSGCWSLLPMLPSAIMHVIRQTVWERSLPRSHKLHTVKELWEIVAALDSESGGTAAAFPYVQRVLELDPQNISAAKFMASYYCRIKRFADALPYLRIAVQNAHPDSIYVVMLEQTLAALGENSGAGVEGAQD